MINEKSTGTNPGQYLDRQKWDTLLDEYYDLHGWDRATGHPRQETLKTLELDDLVDH